VSTVTAPPADPAGLREALASLETVIRGKPRQVRLCLACLLARGHLLIEDVPGVGKTTLAQALARSVRSSFHRLQFTSDMLPSDVLGVTIYNAHTQEFEFKQGPVFTNFLLADEINRATPKTQSALLEAMQERTVTSGNTTHELEAPFLVMATQNPIEMEGTYPLPEAQLDRFLMKIRIGYPDAGQESEILSRYQGGFEARDLDKAGIEPVSRETLQAAREEIARLRVEPKLFDYIVAIVRATRDSAAASLGASPRAAVAMMAASKAFAATEGRDFLIPDDVKSAALPILRHRILLKPEADLEGITPDQVINEVVAGIAVPK